MLEPMAMAAYLAIVVARLENPVTHLRNYKSHRGMSWKTDATDWLGGYPFEVATPEEITRFYSERGFRLQTLVRAKSLGTNQFVFQRPE